MSDDDYSAQRSYEFQQSIDPSLAKHMLDFEEVIDSTRLIFAGMDVDYSTTPPRLVKFGEPMMTEYGIGRVVAKLKIIHKGIPVATLNEKTPYVHTRIMTFNLAKELFVNWEKYGIKSTSDADKIIEMVMTSLLAAFSRAVGGGEKNFIKGYARENRTIGSGKGSGRLSI